MFKLNHTERKLEYVNHVKIADITSTFVLKNSQINSDVEYTIFGVQSMPPRVYEITLLKGQLDNPFIMTSYGVKGDDMRYIALPSISANMYYVVI
jgi:hypothetical protein